MPAEFAVRCQRAQSEKLLFSTDRFAGTKSVGPNLFQLPPLIVSEVPPQCDTVECCTVDVLPVTKTQAAPPAANDASDTTRPCAEVAENRACVETAVVMLVHESHDVPCS